MTTQHLVLLLHVGNVGSRGVELGAKHIELQGLFVLLGLGGGFRGLGLEQVLDLLHLLPWLGALLGLFGVLRLEQS